ncbi:MAG: 2,3-bisphosphoglycerate-dependent phosphoglycerate mutase [Chloroflexota bacterium]|jgi:broad specificity phosphatase PhoE|nr:2,3-bisphosphoglycerate-dependent phosphoglycerate mutase [Chloroflexota bacterium]
MPIEIVFETHSISVDNERGIATGWLPGRLSERGRRLAGELGARRRDTGLAAVFSSDLARAVETVAIAFANTAVPIHADPRLRECDYGELNGAAVGRLSPRSRFIGAPFPGGESYADVVVRVRDFLADLTTYDGRRVLVVGHSATRWALEHLLAGRSLEDLVDAPFDWQPGWTFELTRTASAS